MSAISSTPTDRTGTLGVAYALGRREFSRFIRQRSRLAGSIGQPLLFWLVLGTGLSPSFRAGGGLEGVSYMEYFYPGVLMMMVLFASIFSTITVIEDRDQGFLQGVLVAPVSRLAIVLGKIGGAAAVALFQALILLLAAPFLGFPAAGPVAYLFVIATLILVSLGYTGLSFFVAWGMQSTSGYHAIMMLVMMPMWFLSGALFPIDGVPVVLKGLMWLNPVTHGMTLLRAPFYSDPGTFLTDSGYLIALAVVLVWVAVALWASAWRVGRKEKGAAAA